MYCKSLFTCETIVSQNFMRLMTCEENSFGENYELRIRILPNSCRKRILQNKSELQYTKKTGFEEQNSSVKTYVKNI